MITFSSCKSKINLSQLQGKWLVDSVSVYENGVNKTIRPDINDNEAVKLICDAQIFEFNDKSDLAIYNASNDSKRDVLHFQILEDSLLLTPQKKTGDSVKFFIRLLNENALTIRFAQKEGEVAYYLSKRDLLPISASIKADTIALDLYKAKMEEARRDLDENENSCLAIAKMYSLQNVLSKTIENEPYSNGFKVALYFLAVDSKNSGLAKELTSKILNEPNQQFNAVEYVHNKGYAGQLKVVNWLYGYTHAAIAKKDLDEKLKKEKSVLNKAYLNKDFALKWYKFNWGRLESGDGMSYADYAVENIYYDDELDYNVKEKVLTELSNKLEGSAKGNAFYCLFLTREKSDFYKKEAREYLLQAKSVYEALNGNLDNHNRQEMLDLINEKLQAYN